VDGASYRLRIFTPATELPFAGHPSVGAAVTQHRRGLLPADEAHQECGAGVLAVRVHADGRATLRGGTPSLGSVLDPAPYLAATGLVATDLAGPPVRVAGCGLEFPYLAVRPDAVGRAVALRGDAGVDQVYLFAWDPQSRVAHARLFAPGLGVPEDPATGSAALGLGVYLVGTGLLDPEGDSAYTVRQGAEIHRPSTMECVVSAVDGRAVRAELTGAVAPIARGEIAVPPFVG
jgi:trans-2,3-dihydro-3-hydroxyanthranilate isomerase